ncbi:alanine/glycine:cation symporter family protein [Lacinutrix undariae]
MKKYLLSIFTLILPFISIAQDAQEKGIDEKINDAFMPVAKWWEGFVLTTVPIGEHDIPFVVILLVLGATFFTIYFRFPAFTKFITAINTVRGKYVDIEKHGVDKLYNNDEALAEEDIQDTIRDESAHGEVSHFQALATAVSGTVGLGNIAGVAVAIALGGPGATFWMIVCGLIGMSTKFVECTLGVKYRDVGEDGTIYGGPMYYLSKGLKDIGFTGAGKILGGLFAILCVGASFGGGNAFQSNQATVQLISLFGLKGGSSGFIIGIILAILVGIVIIGGIKRIAKITEKIVPFMAGIYVIASLIIIFAHISYIDDAFALIFEGAFTPMAGLGGVVGVIIVGFQRAAFSNEAGAGSAAIAHSAVRTKYPASEGVVALLEPFIDTVVICTMTALVIIFFNIDGDNMQSIFQYGASGGSGSSVLLNDGSGAIGGVDLTSMAFDAVIPGFSYILTIAIVLFAFSTMVSWSYYGLQSWKYLFGRGKAADIVYKILFLIFIVIGAAVTLDAVIKFSDAMILALVFPNMIGLLFLFPKVREEMKRYIRAITIKKDALEDGHEDITKHM